MTRRLPTLAETTGLEQLLSEFSLRSVRPAGREPVEPQNPRCTDIRILNPVNDLLQSLFPRALETFLRRVQPCATCASYAFEIQVFKYAACVNLEVPNLAVAILLHQFDHDLDVAIDDDSRFGENVLSCSFPKAFRPGISL